MSDHEEDGDSAVIALLKRLSDRMDGLVRQISASPLSTTGDRVGPQVVPANIPPLKLPGASGIEDAARQGGLLASRLTLNDLQQQAQAAAGNQFAQGSFYIRAACGQDVPGMVGQPHEGISEEQYQRGVEKFGPSWVAVPSNKTSELMIQCFTSNELYVKLGSGYREWAFRFLEALEMAEMATGYRWAERVKVNKLGEFLQRDSSAADYFCQNVATRWAINPQLTYMLDEMFNVATRSAVPDASGSSEQLQRTAYCG
uniref:RxLR effector candidate protein n=1 Tax=Hyaloperonospora arabidopsidis (strain Emoy2) TaxID=559515 RepID=M4BPN1_HYAAE